MAFGFGPFQVIARTSVGPTAQTFLALEGAKDGLRPVCLRTLLPQLSANPKSRKTFSDEAQIAARLNHPGCVGVEKWGVENDICWISTPFIAGETWDFVLEKAEPKLPVGEVVFVIADLCAGLHYAHTLSSKNGPYNIVHRGISSNTIVIGDDGRARIMDFGTGKSRIVNDATETGIIKGSFRYMSPEQILGSDPDHRSDVYSLAEVLFESLTGWDATGGAIEEIAVAKLDGHPRLSEVAPGVHDDLDAICDHALAVRPEDRYESAAAMRTALLAYVDKLQRKPSRDSVKRLLQKMFGNRISKRAEALRSLTHGELDEAEVYHAFGARPVSEKDLYEGPGGGAYDEAAFLATIRPGEMHEQAPLKRRRTKPAEARLKLRAPNRAESIPDPLPPTQMQPIDDVAELQTDALLEDELDLDFELPDLDDVLEEVASEGADPAERETGVVDPEPTGIFKKGSF